jgi:H+-transporting ATPase
MHRVLGVATVLGMIGVVETFGLLLIGKMWFNLNEAQIQSFIYLKLAVAGHLTLFVARTKRPFLSSPHPAPVLLVAVLCTQLLAVLIVGFGFLVVPIPWSYIGLVWVYCLVWVFIEDWGKLHIFHHLALTGIRHKRFLDKIKKPFHHNLQ